MMHRTLPEIAQLLAVGPAGLRLLRHLAHPNSGVLQPSVILDGRGMQGFDVQECFRAALAMALCRQGLTVPAIREALEQAEAGLFQMRHAISATIEGQPCHFRIATFNDGHREACFTVVGDSLPQTAESVLVVALGAVWDPLRPRGAE